MICTKLALDTFGFRHRGERFERCMSNNRKWYNDIQRQSSRPKVKEETSTESYWQMKQE